MWFENWYGLLRVVVMTVLTYCSLILMVRLSGKRTLAKMNAFDLVVTVAFGSMLASIILSKNVALAEGLLGLALLISLQWAIAWLSVRSTWARRLSQSEPTLLVYQGRYLFTQMRRERVSEGEVQGAMRSAGISEIAEVGAVVLETDGSLSVLPQGKAEGLNL